MPNPYGALEVSVQEVEGKRQAGDKFIWLDVREQNEVASVYIDDERIVVVPLSELAQKQLDALPATVNVQSVEIVTFCHHGVRSAQVAAWLMQQGWTNVTSMAGGIDAWAKEIDGSVGFY
jgi:rhodanese-related sulfurtransferase